MVVADRIAGISSSVAVKAPVRVATTAAVTLTGLTVVDGVQLAYGDRVLVKNQANQLENGIYDAYENRWVRSKDFDGARDAVDGTLVYCNEGTANGDTYYRLASGNPVTFGTSAIVFEYATLGAGAVAAAEAAAAIAVAAKDVAEDKADEAEASADLAEYFAEQAANTTNLTRITPTGSTLKPARSLADHLSNGGLFFHSNDFSGIDHSGALDSLSATQKLLNKGNASRHTTIVLDEGAIKLGNAVPAMSAIVGGLTITSITYLSNGVVRVGFSDSSSLTSSTVTTGIATGSSFLTIEGAANDENNGRFTMLSMDNTTGSKNITISTPRTTNLLDEVGLSLTTNANRIRIAGLEPLYVRDNTTLIVNCDLLHYINSGQQHIMCCYNITTDGGYTTYDVELDFGIDGCVVFPDLGTPSPSKKGAALTYVERFRVKGYRSRGNDRGSFDLQIRNGSYGHISGNTQYSGDSVGEDGVHLIKTCRYITISDLVVNSGDDSLSFTQESSSVPYVIEHVVVSNCILRTANNSSFKCFLDSQAAMGGAIIRNIAVDNCHFGVHDNNGVGTLVRVSSVTGYEDSVSNITFTNCTTDNIGDGTGALASTSIRFDYVADCQISDSSLFNGVRNLIIINGGKRNIIRDNMLGKPAPQTSVSNVTGLTVTDITQVSGQTFRATFSGSPDLSTVAASSTFSAITIAGATNPVNNGTFEMVSVDNTAKTVNYTVSQKYASASYNETGIAATAYVRKQAGELISIAGGDGHLIQGNYFTGSTLDSGGLVICAANGILMKTNTVTSQVPINHRITGNHFTGFVVASCIFLQNGRYYMVDGNTATGNTARNFIVEGSNCDGDGYFLDNREYGSVKCPISYHLNEPTSKHRGNIGSNADTVTGSITIPNGSTSVTINIPNHYDAPTGASPAIGWTQGFNLGDPTPRNLILTPTTSYGAAKQERVSYTSGTRNFTITLDANPGADVTWYYTLSMANDF